MDTETRVKGILKKELGINDEIKPDQKLIDDLGADSLDAVELVMALEEEFKIEIPDEDAEKMVTVNDILVYIEKHLPK